MNRIFSHGEGVKDKHFKLYSVWLVGFYLRSGVVHKWVFLSARWKGSLAPPDEPPSFSTKLPVEYMYCDTSCAEFELAVFIEAFLIFFGEVGVFHDACFAVEQAEVADFFERICFWYHF